METEKANYPSEQITDQILRFFWRGNPAPPQYSEKSAQFASFVLKEAIEASNLMHLVPKPGYSPPGISWLLQAAVQAVWNKIKYGGDIYESVRIVVAQKQKSNYEALVAGIDILYP